MSLNNSQINRLSRIRIRRKLSVRTAIANGFPVFITVDRSAKIAAIPKMNVVTIASTSMFGEISEALGVSAFNPLFNFAPQRLQ